MRILGAFLAVVGSLGACSSTTTTTTSTGACGDITGNYTVTEKTISSNCAPSDGGAADAPLNVSIQDVGGAYSAIIPGIDGSCPGTFDPSTCKLQLSCNVTVSGATALSFSINWTIKGGALTGSEIDQAFPPAVPSECQLSASDNGTKL